MDFKTETKSREKVAPLIEIVDKPDTQPQAELDGITRKNTRTYAEDTSVINLNTLPDKISVLITPLEYEGGFKELLEKGKDKKSCLFKGVNSSRLKELFQHATRKISIVYFTEVERDVFQASYKRSLKEKIYTATQMLNETYKD